MEHARIHDLDLDDVVRARTRDFAIQRASAYQQSSIQFGVWRISGYCAYI